jgi:hypothetical protein
MMRRQPHAGDDRDGRLNLSFLKSTLFDKQPELTVGGEPLGRNVSLCVFMHAHNHSPERQLRAPELTQA